MYQATFMALSPIFHGSDIKDGEKGHKNHSPFREMRFTYPGEEGGTESVDLPVISGNAMRGVFRRIGAQIALDELGMTAYDIPEHLYYMLTSGGGLQDKNEFFLIRNMLTLRAAFPHLSLFGGGYMQRILEGKLIVYPMIPLVKETEFITGVSKEDVSEWDYMMMGDQFFTRHPKRREDDLTVITEEEKEAKEEGDETDSSDDGKEKKKKKNDYKSPMIYSMEVLYPGIKLFHSISLKPYVTDVEKSLLSEILRRFESNALVGGQISRGMGRLKTMEGYAPELVPFSVYQEYIEKHRETIKEYVGCMADKSILKATGSSGKTVVANFSAKLEQALEKMVRG